MEKSKADEEEPKQGSEESINQKRNLNSYYGNKIGLFQSVSLILNAGLMVYAHLGLSAVIFSSRDPTLTSIENIDGNNTNSTNSTNSACNAQDIQIWRDNGGVAERPAQSNFCSRDYTGYSGNACLTNAQCIEDCFQKEYGYSPECTTCFGSIPLCSISNGCTVVCAADSLGDACADCNIPCIEDFQVCSGLPGDNTSIRHLQSINSTTGACNEYDLDLIDTWYTAYNLTFVGSVNDAWNGDAQLLAFIVVVFSGIWPYAKNVILLIVWYLPMPVKAQTSIILWLSRLSKYTLVDVYAVIVLLVGVQLQLNIGGTDAVIRAEPRFGIIAFFLSTLWEFIQIEAVKAMHEEMVNNYEEKQMPEGNQEIVATKEDNNNKKEEQLLFSSHWIPVLLLLVSIALYVAGAISEIVYFKSTDIGSDETCIKSYNLASLGNALVNDLSLIDNSVAWQTWILYLVYIFLNWALPIMVHLLQIVFLVGWTKYPSMTSKLKSMTTFTVAFWCFACIEVLVIGIFAIEYKFPQLITKLAGDSNAMFLDIISGLGPGFYLLIMYSIVAGFLQFSLRMRYSTA
jgi:hypothetical protein